MFYTFLVYKSIYHLVSNLFSIKVTYFPILSFLLFLYILLKCNKIIIISYYLVYFLDKIVYYVKLIFDWMYILYIKILLYKRCEVNIYVINNKEYLETKTKYTVRLIIINILYRLWKNRTKWTYIRLKLESNISK